MSKQKHNFCTKNVVNLYVWGNSMKNLLSYFGLTDARIRASEKDLPLQLRVEPAAGKPATEIKIVTLFLLGKKRGHPGNIFTKLKLLNVDELFIIITYENEKLNYNSRFLPSPLCTILFAIKNW